MTENQNQDQDHVATAVSYLDRAWRASYVLGGVPMTALSDEAIAVRIASAQVHATLALVEQQRIANLIALFAALRTNSDGSESGATDAVADSAFDEAIAALGFTGGEVPNV